MKTARLLSSGALALSLLAGSVTAAVSPDEAAKLGSSLTLVGAEKAASSDGAIPAYAGGLTSAPAGFKAGDSMRPDPFASEKPLMVIDGKNVEQYKNQLSATTVELARRYPTFRVDVYPTHRSAALPDTVLENSRKNAVTAQSLEGGTAIDNALPGVPFPIPKSGVEVIWNHITRYRGGSVSRLVTQATPQQNGSYSMVKLEEQFMFRDRLKDFDPANPGNVLFYFKQKVTAPPRLAGTVLLVHETLDQVKEPRLAWVYNAGQRRVRRAPQVAYDGPGTAADGLRTSDNFDMFSGAPDRYDWKLVGKREMYIPYNAYKWYFGIEAPEQFMKITLTRRLSAGSCTASMWWRRRSSLASATCTASGAITWTRTPSARACTTPGTRKAICTGPCTWPGCRSMTKTFPTRPSWRSSISTKTCMACSTTS